MLNALCENVIIAALRKGNIRRAVELVLDMYQDDVFSYCARLVGPADAINICHQVMSNSLEHLTTYDGSTSVRAWLYGISRNNVIGHHRKFHDHYRGAMEAAYVPVGQEMALEVLQVVDEHLEEGLDGLDPAVREVLQLSLWHGLLLSEVAHVIGCSTVKVRKMAAEGLSNLSCVLRNPTTAPS